MQQPRLSSGGPVAVTPGEAPAPGGVAAALGRVLRLQESALVAALLLVSAYLATQSPVFLTQRNISVLLLQSSMTAIAAFGMTMLIIGGEVDLSIGSLQAFVGVLTMQILNATQNLWIGVIVGLGIGALVGLANGLITLKTGISSFIVTLAMFSIIRGLSYASTNAAVQNSHNLPEFFALGNGYLFFIPWPVVIMIVTFVAFYLVLNRTTFGRYIYAIGGNRRAAILSGVRVNTIKLIAFVVTSVLASLSAIILISRMNSGQNNAGFGFELQVIGAVILGGTSLYGGQGSLVGTLLAVLLLAVLNNGVILLGWNSSVQVALNGLVILLAVYLDAQRRRLAGEVS